MSLPEFSNTNTTNTEPDFIPNEGLDSSHSPSIQSSNTFQLIGNAWNRSDKRQKAAFSAMLVLVFGLPLFIGLGVRNRQLINQKAAEPARIPVTPPNKTLLPLPSTKPTLKPAATKIPTNRPIPIPSPQNPAF